MPYGEHRVQCMHCGVWFTCGDCILSTCRECEKNGHSGIILDCPVCSKEFEDRRARIDAAIAEKFQAKQNEND